MPPELVNHFESDVSLELSLTFGGSFVHVPVGQYVGGGTVVLSLLEIQGAQMGLAELMALCVEEGIDKIRGFYTLVDGGFLLVQLGKLFVKALKNNKKLTLYVDCS